MKEKSKRTYRLRQNVGLWSFLFPSSVPSGFDLEAPCTLEAARERLRKLNHVRVSKEMPLTQVAVGLLLESQLIDQPTALSVAPISFSLEKVDDDTDRYQVDAFENGFNISVRGYLKRWEQDTTLVTGRVYFDLHYTSVLLRSLLLAMLAVPLVLGIALFLAYFLPLGLWNFIFNAPPLLEFALARWLIQIPAFALPIWLGILAVLWLNQVAAPAQQRRFRLLTRIEDLLLLGDLVGG